MAKAKRLKVGSRAWERQQHEAFTRQLARDPAAQEAIRRGLDDVRSGRCASAPRVLRSSSRGR